MNIQREALKRITRMGAMLILIGVGCFASSLAQDSGAPLVLRFSQAPVSKDAWAGVVSGAVRGKLKTTLVSADTSSPVWQVSVDWVIEADEPAYSFVVRLLGTWDSITGATDMVGVISEGHFAGMRVHEVGRSIYPGHHTSFGSLRILRA